MNEYICQVTQNGWVIYTGPRVMCLDFIRKNKLAIAHDVGDTILCYL